MSGEMELEPVPHSLGATKETLIVNRDSEKVTIVILPDDGPEPVAEDITLDGDPDEDGKGLPSDMPQDDADLPGDPDDVNKGLA